MERVKTYIEDLDNALNGGIPLNNTTLLAGSAGSGKTTLAMQFLCSGVNNENTPAILFTFNENDYRLTDNLTQFSFFKEEAIRSNTLMIVDLKAAIYNLSSEKVFTTTNLMNLIYTYIFDYKPKRIVIDSITALCHGLDDAHNVRKFLFELGNMLLLNNCSAILVSEVPPGARTYSSFGVEEFVCDGIIFLSHVDKNNRLRKTLQVVKMRGTAHSEDQFIMIIDNNGIHLMKSLDG